MRPLQKSKDKAPVNLTDEDVSDFFFDKASLSEDDASESENEEVWECALRKVWKIWMMRF